VFVDEVEIEVRSGNGGDGCVSFRREKYIPKGGPDGGDGGSGGDLVFEVDPQMNTLTVFSGKHHWIAGNGRPGEGSNRSGKSSDDLVIRVPPGTSIYDRETKLRLRDLTRPQERVILIKGGRGGLGNSHFATPTKQTPRHAMPGEPGRGRSLRLELKLIADVGLVGMPNAGKSTLLSRTTKARPRIADYPFTTLVPQLGIVELPGYRQYVLADIPGLIEGAHEGTGLGDAFLRHIERTRVIAHLVDIVPLDGQPPPEEAYRIVRGELEKYSSVLADKPEIVVANKTDLTDSDEKVRELQDALDCEIIPISAVTGAGLEPLHKKLWPLIESRKRLEEEDQAGRASSDS
jgi:GTP-binding protein